MPSTSDQSPVSARTEDVDRASNNNASDEADQSQKDASGASRTRLVIQMRSGHNRIKWIQPAEVASKSIGVTVESGEQGDENTFGDSNEKSETAFCWRDPPNNCIVLEGHWMEGIKKELVHQARLCCEQKDWAPFKYMLNKEFTQESGRIDFDGMRVVVFVHLMHQSDRRLYGVADTEFKSPCNWSRGFHTLIERVEQWDLFPKAKEVLATMEGPKGISSWTNPKHRDRNTQCPQVTDDLARPIMKRLINSTLNSIYFLQQSRKSENVNLLINEMRIGIVINLSGLYLMCGSSWNSIIEWLVAHDLLQMARGVVMVVVGWLRDCGLPTDHPLLRIPFLKDLVPTCRIKGLDFWDEVDEWTTKDGDHLEAIYTRLMMMAPDQHFQSLFHSIARRRIKRTRAEMEFEDTPSTTESVTSSNISELLKMFGDVRLKESSSLHIVKMQPLGSLLDMLVYLQTTVINQNDRKTVYHVRGHQDAIHALINMMTYCLNNQMNLVDELGFVNWAVFSLYHYMTSVSEEDIKEMISKGNLEFNVNEPIVDFLTAMYQRIIWHNYLQIGASPNVFEWISSTLIVWVQRHSISELFAIQKSTRRALISDFIEEGDWAPLRHMVMWKDAEAMMDALEWVGNDVIGVALCSIDTLLFLCTKMVEQQSININSDYWSSRGEVAIAIGRTVIEGCCRWYEGIKECPEHFQYDEWQSVGKELYVSRLKFKKVKRSSGTPSPRKRLRLNRDDAKSNTEVSIDSINSMINEGDSSEIGSNVALHDPLVPGNGEMANELVVSVNENGCAGSFLEVNGLEAVSSIVPIESVCESVFCQIHNQNVICSLNLISNQ